MLLLYVVLTVVMPYLQETQDLVDPEEDVFEQIGGDGVLYHVGDSDMEEDGTEEDSEQGEVKDEPQIPRPRNMNEWFEKQAKKKANKKKGRKNEEKKTVRQKRSKLKDSVRGITKGSIKRIMRRAGVKRASGVVFNDVRQSMKNFVENLVQKASHYAQHAKRNTITAKDVVHACRSQGKMLYGYDT